MHNTREKNIACQFISKKSSAKYIVNHVYPMEQRFNRGRAQRFAGKNIKSQEIDILIFRFD
jgi:hypothetical protein